MRSDGMPTIPGRERPNEEYQHQGGCNQREAASLTYARQCPWPGTQHAQRRASPKSRPPACSGPSPPAGHCSDATPRTPAQPTPARTGPEARLSVAKRRRKLGPPLLRFRWLQQLRPLQCPRPTPRPRCRPLAPRVSSRPASPPSIATCCLPRFLADSGPNPSPIRPIPTPIASSPSSPLPLRLLLPRVLARRPLVPSPRAPHHPRISSLS